MVLYCMLLHAVGILFSNGYARQLVQLGPLAGYPGRYYAVLRNTVVIPAIFGSKFEDVARKIGSN
jgi:hypothetical protein